MSAESKNKIRQHLFAVLRILFGLTLAGVLIYFTLKRSGGNLWQELYQGSAWLLTAAFILYGLIILVGVYRLKLLLSVQGIEFPFGALTRLTMIGVFFSMVIPGAVGGDLVKMAYVTRHTPGKRAEAVLTIMLDRIFGIFGLFLIATVMILIFWGWLREQDGRLQAAAFFVGSGSVAGVLAIIVLEMREFFLRLKIIAGICEFLERKLPDALTSMIKRVIKALDLLRRARKAALASVALSLVVHFGLGITLFWIGTGIGEKTLRFLDYLLVIQVGNAVGAIPVTPAGVGTRDAIITLFFEAMQGAPEKCAVIAVTLSLIIVAYAVIGALVFILSPGVRPKNIEEQIL